MAVRLSLRRSTWSLGLYDHFQGRDATGLLDPLYLLGGVVTALYLEQFHDWVLRHKRALLSWTVVFAALPSCSLLLRHGHHVPKFLVPGGDPFAAVVVPYT